MRPVLHSDVTSVARALLAVPRGARDDFCARLLQQADWADRYTRKRGKPHPEWGNGTLLGAARRGPLATEPTLDDPAYCEALQTVLAQLAARSTAPRL